MLGKIIFILIFLKCSGKIEIDIKTSVHRNKNIIKFNGEDLKIVTDKEIDVFRITDANLKKGVRVEMGKIPDDVFLKDPTPYEDLFRTYEWEEVTRKFVIRDIKLIEFIKNKEVLSTCEYINNTTDINKKVIELKEMVENTVEMVYPNNGLPEDEIYLKIFIDFDKGQWIYENKWRNDSVRAIKLPYKETLGEIKMAGGQTITAVLTASKIVMLLEIQFDAYLIGNVIANYGRLYGKYHFWAPTVNNIMKAAKLKNLVVTKVLMELRYFTEPKLKVIDKDTGEELNVGNKKNKRRKKVKIVF